MLEIFGVTVGFVYLYLEWRASVWLWLASIIMPAVYIFVYYNSGFYADFAMNIYYLLASIYGWVLWSKKTSKNTKNVISAIKRSKFCLLFIVGCTVWSVVWFFLITFTDSTVPIGDSFTTAASIIAMWMLAKKYVEQWLVWMAVDIVCTILYLHKGLYPTAILYGIYSIIAIFGYLKWKKLSEQVVQH